MPITRLCLVSCGLSGLLYALLPFATLLRSSTAAVYGAVLVQQCLLRCALGTAFTCTFTLLTNSVPPSRRGSMQGLAMTVGSGARA